MGKNDRAPEPIGGMNAEGGWTKSSRIWIPEIEAEHRIRVARIKQDLALEDRAAQDGEENQPSRSDTTLNEPQMEVCNRVFAGILMLNQFLSEQVGMALKQARQLILPELNADRARHKITKEIDTLFMERRPELVALRSEDLRRQRALRFFRHKNGLHHPAHYPDSPAFVIGIMSVAFVVESVMNGSLLQAIMSNGLLGGALLAALISAVNIALGLVAGFYGWRYSGHCRRDLRIRGWIALVSLHLAAMAWNLLIAHFREVAEIAVSGGAFDFDIAALSAATLQHVATNGVLGMGSIQAWALLLIGFLVHFLAAKEGWDDLADRYPDYARHERAARKSRAAFEEALADLRQDTREAVEAVEATVEAAASRASDNHHEVCGLLDLAHQRRQEVKDSEDEWVTGGSQLLKAYRDINSKVRDEGSAPKHFAVYPTADDYRRRDFGVGMPRSDEVEEQARAVDRAIEELGTLKTKARAQADGAADVLAEIHRHITLSIRKLDKRLESEDRAITDRAKELVDSEEDASDQSAAPDSEPGLTPNALA